MNQNVTQSPNKSKMWLWLFIILVVVIAGGFLVWWFLIRESTSNGSTTTTTTQETTSKTAEKWTLTNEKVLANVTSSDTRKLSDGTYRMYYMNQNGIVYADSSDATTFSDPQPTGVTQEEGMMISNPSVIEIADGNWIMIYEQKEQTAQNKNQEGQRDLYLATSTDGKSFTKAGIAVDSSKEDDSFASVPNLVLLSDGNVRMYYVCGGQETCARVSKDSGQTWTKEAFKFSDKSIQVVDPDVLYQKNKWVMYYSNLDPQKNGLYKATSTDGLSWTALSGQIVTKESGAIVVDPDVVELSTNKYKMFYGQSMSVEGMLDLYSATYDGNIF